ncbi:hypothetical protein PSI17_08370 [Xenorhabdus sp. IM139775]|nr:hypothetical protein [Xenorhabdus sp. IM139775]MDC9593612.1 hypothetical protein [Xenorhabdus sp. IM139775]
MPCFSRREILRAATIGIAYSLLPASIRKALAIPANNRTGTIDDVAHVVNSPVVAISGSSKVRDGWSCPITWTAGAAMRRGPGERLIPGLMNTWLGAAAA